MALHITDKGFIMRLPFQLDRPVFVTKPMLYKGKDYKKHDHFPWKEMSLKWEDVCRLYDSVKLEHSNDLEVKAKVGDGLEQLDINGLHEIVKTINEKVKNNTDSERKYNAMKCKKSKIADKQRAFIRSWRRQYGEMENS